MSSPVSVWLEIAHHPAHRVGGWAFVRLAAGEVSGTAGGERRVDLERTSFLALIAALRDLAPGAPVELHSSSPHILAIPRRIAAAEAGEHPPAENLHLWAQATTTLRARTVVMRRGESAPRTPSAFSAAWAELARDRAKDKGPFSSAIPKPNLAKAGVPGG